MGPYPVAQRRRAGHSLALSCWYPRERRADLVADGVRVLPFAFCLAEACGNGAESCDRCNTQPKNHEKPYLQAGQRIQRSDLALRGLIGRSFFTKHRILYMRGEIVRRESARPFLPESPLRMESFLKGEYKTRNKMFTTEVTEVTENAHLQSSGSVKRHGRLAGGPRNVSGRGCEILILLRGISEYSGRQSPSRSQVGGPVVGARGKHREVARRVAAITPPDPLRKGGKQSGRRSLVRGDRCGVGRVFLIAGLPAG